MTQDFFTETETKIIIDSNGTIFKDIRTTAVIGDQRVVGSWLREVYPPTPDNSELPSDVKGIAAVVWTPEIVAAHAPKLESAANV